MDKNIVGYCRYIGLVSFVAYRSDKARAARTLAAPPQTPTYRANRYRHGNGRVYITPQDMRMTHRDRYGEI
ncbi:hypothetical protein [Paraburkholderia ginsengiterrae]|uniref:hypothetical protein n=1 Tax=Paraburkholderia ginsengiterrae TaxID=1462993 RepID=UPI000AA1BD19|nr:hypothetical protein [Paraburkholderia ginsengiterrae]